MIMLLTINREVMSDCKFFNIIKLEQMKGKTKKYHSKLAINVMNKISIIYN